MRGRLQTNWAILIPLSSILHDNTACWELKMLSWQLSGNRRVNRWLIAGRIYVTWMAFRTSDHLLSLGCPQSKLIFWPTDCANWLSLRWDISLIKYFVVNVSGDNLSCIQRYWWPLLYMWRMSFLTNACSVHAIPSEHVQSWVPQPRRF